MSKGDRYRSLKKARRELYRPENNSMVRDSPPLRELRSGINTALGRGLPKKGPVKKRSLRSHLLGKGVTGATLVAGASHGAPIHAAVNVARLRAANSKTGMQFMKSQAEVGVRLATMKSTPTAKSAGRLFGAFVSPAALDPYKVTRAISKNALKDQDSLRRSASLVTSLDRVVGGRGVKQLTGLAKKARDGAKKVATDAKDNYFSSRPRTAKAVRAAMKWDKGNNKMGTRAAKVLAKREASAVGIDLY